MNKMFDWLASNNNKSLLMYKALYKNYQKVNIQKIKKSVLLCFARTQFYADYKTAVIKLLI